MLEYLILLNFSMKFNYHNACFYIDSSLQNFHFKGFIG